MGEVRVELFGGFRVTVNGRVVGEDALRANQAWARGELDRAEELADEARGLAEEHGDADDLAAVDETFAIISHLRGDWRRRPPGRERVSETEEPAAACLSNRLES
jgi:hypothetical protein